MRKLAFIALGVILVFTLGCSGGSDAVTPPTIEHQAAVGTFEITDLDGNLVASGSLVRDEGGKLILGDMRNGDLLIDLTWIGWFDAVVVRKSVRLNGIETLAITHLDVLDQFDEIPVCVGYRCDGKEVAHFPNQIGDLARCEPVYETMPGWKSDTSKTTNFGDLPANAQRYVDRIGELVGAPVTHILVGRERGQSIIR